MRETAAATADITVLVLGPTAVRVGGLPVDLGGPRQRRLLTALALDAGSAVPGDRLIDRVWHDGGLPDDPRRALRTYLHRLRRALGRDEAVATEPGGLRLDLAVVSVDAVRFTDLVAAAGAGGLDTHGRLGRLEAALALWRGDAYEEVAGAEWARAEVDRLNELRVTAVERRYQAMLDAGMHTDALPELMADAETYPLRDRLVGLEMVALFRSGRQAEATRVFQDHRRRLGEELGLEPGVELVELDRRIVAGDPSLRLTAPAGRALRGYRLGEQLGEGAFAVVFRGTQPSVGREVAVKIVRSELANQPEFVRRFEAEAQLVARLEHPHIVPLYDYWREPDRAFLVLRYLRGGNLESRLTTSGGLTVKETSRLVTQVGSALAAAHAVGVVHRDVKPANVFLDEVGNFYLGDFGIALEAAEVWDPGAALSVGSPAYASPEQLRREPVGPSADVHGLGISVYEALTARLPFPDAATQAELLAHQLHDPIPPVREVRDDVPAGVDAVLARATAKDPAERYQRVDELVDDLTEALGGEPARPSGRRGAATALAAGDLHNPYKGLRAFTEADATDFYGRERLVSRLIDMLGRPGTPGRVAAVVGPSGIGKSSVVRAGLLPALRRGAVTRSERWFVATMVPGQDPFEELGSALLRVATRVPDQMMTLLSTDHRGIARVVKALVPDDRSDTEVVVVIDQFEEVFTLVEDDALRRRFLAGLEHALADARCPLRVILTMRADFWDRPLRYGSFARLLEPSTVTVTALAPDELERAIVEPAHHSGCEFEPGLVSQIVADVADQPGALPLMQYALTELWDRRVSGLLTGGAYRELGGVAGALTRRADELYQQASAQERAAIRPLFERLVTLGEGAEDTRRRAPMAELGTDPDTRAVIGRYGAARLLSFDHDPATREPTVEVAHEALISQWPRLREWLEEDRDGLRILRHLGAVAREWDRDGRPAAELYRGGRLEAAEEWAVANPGALSGAEQEFLDASRLRRAAEADAERRTNRRLRRLLTGVGIFAVIAVAAGFVAFQQRSQANDNAAEALAQAALADRSAEAAEAEATRADEEAEEAGIRRLVSEAAGLVETNPDTALLLAAEAYRRDPGPLTLSGLQRALTQAPERWLGVLGSGEAFITAGWLDDGTMVGLQEQTLLLYDAETHAELASIDLPAAAGAELPVRAPLEIHGSTVVIGLRDGSVAIIEDGQVDTVAAADAAVSAVALSPDGDHLAVGDVSGVVTLVDLTTGEPLWPSPTLVLPERGIFDIYPAEVRQQLEQLPLTAGLTQWDDIDFRSGPRRLVFDTTDGLVVAAGAHLRRIDTVTGELDRELLLNVDQGLGAVPGAVVDVAVGSDGTLHAVTSQPTGGRYVRVSPGLEAQEWSSVPTGRSDTNHNAAALALDATDTPWFGIDNGLLVRGATEDRTDPANRLLTGMPDLRSISLSADGRQMLVATSTGLLRWSVDGSRLLARAIPRAGNNQMSVDEDGNLVIASDIDPEVASVVYDLSLPSPAMMLTQAVPMTDGMVVANDPLGRFVSTWRDFHTTLLHRSTLESTGLEFDLAGTGESYSPDGRLVALGVGPADTVVRVHDLGNGRAVAALDLEPWAAEIDTNIWGIAFDPTGDHLLVWLESGAAVLFETRTWNVETSIEPNDADGGIHGAEFTSGDVLITRGPNGSIDLRDGDTLEIQRTIEGGIGSWDLFADGPHVSADGEYLLTTRDQPPRLWHIETGQFVGRFPSDPASTAGGNGGGEHLQLVTALGEHALVWNLDVDSWPDIACRAAGRNLTTEEWDQYGPDPEYQATCPQWPAPR